MMAFAVGVWRSGTRATIFIMLVFGVWTSLAMRGPTPWVGLLERINIGAFLVWTSVLALALLR